MRAQAKRKVDPVLNVDRTETCVDLSSPHVVCVGSPESDDERPDADTMRIGRDTHGGRGLILHAVRIGPRNRIASTVSVEICVSLSSKRVGGEPPRKPRSVLPNTMVIEPGLLVPLLARKP